MSCYVVRSGRGASCFCCRIVLVCLTNTCGLVSSFVPMWSLRGAVRTRRSRAGRRWWHHVRLVKKWRIRRTRGQSWWRRGWSIRSAVDPACGGWWAPHPFSPSSLLCSPSFTHSPRFGTPAEATDLLWAWGAGLRGPLLGVPIRQVSSQAGLDDDGPICQVSHSSIPLPLPFLIYGRRCWHANISVDLFVFTCSSRGRRVYIVYSDDVSSPDCWPQVVHVHMPSKMVVSIVSICQINFRWIYLSFYVWFCSDILTLG